MLLSRQFPSGLSLSPELADSPACLTGELRDLLSAAPGLEFDTRCCAGLLGARIRAQVPTLAQQTFYQLSRFPSQGKVFY